jgi:hypothetical protein
LTGRITITVLLVNLRRVEVGRERKKEEMART